MFHNGMVVNKRALIYNQRFETTLDVDESNDGAAGW